MHIGEAVERDGPHHHHVRHAVHLQFERKRDQAFDLFGGVAGPLRDEFDLRRRKVGIGIHRHALERDDASDHDEARQHQHQESLTKRSLYDSMDHSGVDAIVRCHGSQSCLGGALIAAANSQTAGTSCHLR